MNIFCFTLVHSCGMSNYFAGETINLPLAKNICSVFVVVVSLHYQHTLKLYFTVIDRVF